MNNRKSLTKSLHTVTAVSRLAYHLGQYEHRHNDSAETLVRNALSVLGQPYDWLAGDPTMAACIAATNKLRA